MEKIFSPSNISYLLQQIMTEAELHPLSSSERTILTELFEEFTVRWQKSYTYFGQDSAGELAYRDLILFFQEEIVSKLYKYLSKDGPGMQAVIDIGSMLFPQGVRKQFWKGLHKNLRLQEKELPEKFECPKFDRPLFIVSAPRSGSSLLFETLSKFEGIWTIGKENHDIEQDIPYMHPAFRNYASNRLENADSKVAAEVVKWFTRQLRNREQTLYMGKTIPPRSVRFLEKTPKNALRIPFLKAVFPDAKFIFLYRTPEENISSMLEGWRSNIFVAYRDMPRWPYKEWHFLLPQGWESLVDCPLAEIAAYQWQQANQTIINDLKKLDNDDWCLVTYNALIKRPEETVSKIIQFTDIQEDQETQQLLAGGLPLSRMVVSMPSPDKWRKNEEEITPYLRKARSLTHQITTLISKKDTL